MTVRETVEEPRRIPDSTFAHLPSFSVSVFGGSRNETADREVGESGT